MTERDRDWRPGTPWQGVQQMKIRGSEEEEMRSVRGLHREMHGVWLVSVHDRPVH